MKVIILTCNAGQGHNAAAKAILEMLESRNVECEIQDSLSFIGEHFSDIIAKTSVNFVVKMPQAYGLVYRSCDTPHSPKRKSPVYFFNKMYAKTLSKYIIENDFDVAICTHIFPAETLTYLRHKHKLNLKCYFVPTDYTCYPFLEDINMNGIFIPHIDLKNEFTARGIPEVKLISTGIPVSLKYLNVNSKSQAREMLGIPEKMRVYLIMTGGEGCGDAITLTRRLLEKSPEENIRVIVLVGKNDKLYNNLNQRFNGDIRVLAVRFTDQVEYYMDACDVLLTKPGGISSTEAAVKNLPIVHVFQIPGCETKNELFFSERGMSVAANNCDKAASSAIKLAYDETAALNMKEAQRQYINKNAAENIYNIIYDQYHIDHTKKIYCPTKGAISLEMP